MALLDICFHIGVQQENMGCRKTCKVDKLLRQSQRDMVCGQRHRLPAAKKSNQIRGTDKVSLSCVKRRVNMQGGSAVSMQRFSLKCAALSRRLSNSHGSLHSYLIISVFYLIFFKKRNSIFR